MRTVGSLFKNFAKGSATILSEKKDWPQVKRMSKDKNADVWQTVWKKSARPAAIAALEDTDLGLTKKEIVALVNEYGASRKLPFVGQTTKTDIKRLKKLARSKGDLEGEIKRSGITALSRKALIEFEESEQASLHVLRKAHEMMGFTTRTWVAGGAKPCDICLAKAGQTVPINKRYRGGEEVAHAHPRCNCHDEYGGLYARIARSGVPKFGLARKPKPSSWSDPDDEEEAPTKKSPAPKKKSPSKREIQSPAPEKKSPSKREIQASYISKAEDSLGVELSLESLKDDMQRTIGNTLGEYKSRFGTLIGPNNIRSFKAIPGKDDPLGGDTWVMGSDNRMDYRINQDILNGPDYAKKLEEDEDSGFHPKTKDPVKAVIVHEIGHSFKSYSLFDLYDQTPSDVINAFEDLMDSLMFGGEVSKISRYASSSGNREEAFAECFVAAEMGGSEYSDLKSVKLMKSLIKSAEAASKAKVRK